MYISIYIGLLLSGPHAQGRLASVRFRPTTAFTPPSLSTPQNANRRCELVRGQSQFTLPEYARDVVRVAAFQ